MLQYIKIGVKSNSILNSKRNPDTRLLPGARNGANLAPFRHAPQRSGIPYAWTTPLPNLAIQTYTNAPPITSTFPFADPTQQWVLPDFTPIPLAFEQSAVPTESFQRTQPMRPRENSKTTATIVPFHPKMLDYDDSDPVLLQQDNDLPPFRRTDTTPPSFITKGT